MSSYRAGNLGSVLSIDDLLNRRWNVFGACPDSERDTPRKLAVPNAGLNQQDEPEKSASVEYFI